MLSICLSTYLSQIPVVHTKMSEFPHQTYSYIIDIDLMNQQTVTNGYRQAMFHDYSQEPQGKTTGLAKHSSKPMPPIVAEASSNFPPPLNDKDRRRVDCEKTEGNRLTNDGAGGAG